VRVDHVLYAVRDLDAASAAFAERHGLASVPGGRHPSWGTANRIVPLGRPAYVELIAVADPEAAAASDFGRGVLAAVETGQRLAGWAVATDDLDGVARRLGLEVSCGSRTRPDGTTLTWRLAGVPRAMATGAFPFFIQWEGPRDLHPGAAPADHRVTPAGIARVEVTGDERELRAWLGDEGLPLGIAPGPPGLRSVAIATDRGEIVVR
jgi:Glyoxalase-like domain